jgi:hypothetical protein
MYDTRTVDRALALLASGANYSQVSRAIGASRAAIRSWHREGRPGRGRQDLCMRCAGYRFPVPGATDIAYAYLLGLYLGDGYISTGPRAVHRLRISLDRAYPVIVQECIAAVSILAPANQVAVVEDPRANLDTVSAFSKHWTCVFPQHSPGVKHKRPIVLDAWQREILDRYPWRFLRGLIHSDGSRHLNTIKRPNKTYRYPRYEFSNRSDDIRALFCEYCDKVEVEWRPTNRWNISVARRDSVALMDRHIGPKR